MRLEIDLTTEEQETLLNALQRAVDHYATCRIGAITAGDRKSYQEYELKKIETTLLLAKIKKEINGD